MTSILPVIAVFVVVGLLLFFVVTNSTKPTIPVQLPHVDEYLPNGAHATFNLPLQPVVTAVQNQVQATQNIIQQNLKLIGKDSHGNTIYMNNTQIVNTSSLSPNATNYINTHPDIFQPSNQINVGSVSYSNNSVNVMSNGNPIPVSQAQAQQVVVFGNPVKISGTFFIPDNSTCHVVTQNNYQTVQCNPVAGSYHWTMQILCVDTNIYRCSAIHGDLPTNRGEADPPNHSFYQEWTPTGSDPNYIGNYDARFYVESEVTDASGRTWDVTFDHPFSIVGNGN